LSNGIATAVPVVSTPWFDDRQACKIVHAYLTGKVQGRFEDYRTCSNYVAGVCAGTRSAGMLCLFHEPDTSLVWGLARRCQRVPTQDGAVAVTASPQIRKPTRVRTRADSWAGAAEHAWRLRRRPLLLS
jgi:hypothetical protein